jgi:polar amino acid transport system substrate-binding protein
MSVPNEIMKSLAPTGVIRAAINLSNAMLAQRDPHTGETGGVAVELARELGKASGLPVSLVHFDAAGKVFEAIREGAWDIAFLAADPARATEILFTAPYALVEGSYMLRAGSPLRTLADVDQPGVRVTVSRKSGYDLYLTRTLKHAQIMRASSASEAIELFLREGYEVVAGVKNPLVRFAAERPDLRVMAGRFMVIEQAMGAPRGREAAWPYLCAFVERMKASGMVARVLQRSGAHDALVAPPAG